MPYTLLRSPWKKELVELVREAKSELVIASPFVNAAGIHTLLGALPIKRSLHLSFTTNLTMQNIVTGVTEPEAFLARSAETAGACPRDG
jgi:hypothetical protein